MRSKKVKFGSLSVRGVDCGRTAGMLWRGFTRRLLSNCPISYALDLSEARASACRLFPWGTRWAHDYNKVLQRHSIARPMRIEDLEAAARHPKTSFPNCGAKEILSVSVLLRRWWVGNLFACTSGNVMSFAAGTA